MDATNQTKQPCIYCKSLPPRYGPDWIQPTTNPTLSPRLLGWFSTFSPFSFLSLARCRHLHRTASRFSCRARCPPVITSRQQLVPSSRFPERGGVHFFFMKRLINPECYIFRCANLDCTKLNRSHCELGWANVLWTLLSTGEACPCKQL